MSQEVSTQEISTQEISTERLAEKLLTIENVSVSESTPAFSNDKNFSKNVTWEEVNLLSKNYIDLMQTMVSYMHRLRKMVEQNLLHKGLVIRTEEITNGRRVIRYVKPDFKKSA